MTLHAIRHWFSGYLRALMLSLLLVIGTGSALAQITPSPTTTETLSGTSGGTPTGVPTEIPAPTLTATPITGPVLNLFWNERFLLLQNPGDEPIDVTELDLRGGQNSFVDGQTWFRASFQNLEPRRCVFIYQFDFSGGEAPPFLEDALELMPDVPCENGEAYYIGVALEDAVWMLDDGEFTAAYAGVETVTCDNVTGSCVVPLTVELPDNVVTLFWSPEMLVLVNTGQTVQDVSSIRLAAGKDSLNPIDDVKAYLRSLRAGDCVVFYGLGVSPQPRLPENVACGEVVAAGQIDSAGFVWLIGEGFTVTVNEVEMICDTFSRTSCVIPLIISEP